MGIFKMKIQGNTVSQTLSLPKDLTEQIDKAWYHHKKKMCQQKTSRSKFVAMLIRKGLDA